MSLNFSDKRQETRRSLKMPIAFFSNKKGNDMASFAFGWTQDVCSQGICVQSRPGHIPGIDSLITLSVTSEAHDQITNYGAPVEIDGQVVWNDFKKQCFGVKFV